MQCRLICASVAQGSLHKPKYRKWNGNQMEYGRISEIILNKKVSWFKLREGGRSTRCVASCCYRCLFKVVFNIASLPFSVCNLKFIYWKMNHMTYLILTFTRLTIFWSQAMIIWSALSSPLFESRSILSGSSLLGNYRVSQKNYSFLSFCFWEGCW